MKTKILLPVALLVIIAILGGSLGYWIVLRHRAVKGMEQFTRQLDQLGISEGTPLATARQILEQHQFTCSVVSYDNLKAITNNPNAVQWTKDFILRNGKTEAVTNISILNCERINTNDRQNRRKAAWIAINNRTLGLMWW